MVIDFLEEYSDLSSSSNVEKVIAKSTFCYAINQMIHAGLLLSQVLSGTAREAALAILGSKAVPSDQVAFSDQKA
ncbi:unnamed protein product [Ilex paraguariensis]|uniref:Uncharacterized protein n=1 Tax=Ilex paraguariensis TaxID=185542 RepID=A0ABC8V6C8_9AQUA